MVPNSREVMTSISLTRFPPRFQSEFGWPILEVQGTRNVDIDLRNCASSRRFNLIQNRKTSRNCKPVAARCRDEAYVEIKI